MKNDINTISFEITKELIEEQSPVVLEKAIPPKLLYRFRRWLKMMRPKGIEESVHLEKFVSDKIVNFLLSKNLKDKDIITSFSSDGSVRFDFGSKVPESVKKAAILWAKRRGLEVIEASLNKSSNSNNYIIFSNSKRNNTLPIVLKRIYYSSKS